MRLRERMARPFPRWAPPVKPEHHSNPSARAATERKSAVLGAVLIIVGCDSRIERDQEGERMKIAVLGTGGVGQTIGTKLVGLGHEVKMGSRDASHVKGLEWVK